MPNPVNNQQPTDNVILTFSLKRQDAEQFKRRFRKHGERSHILQWFVRMFLEGRIDLTTERR